MGKFRVLSSQSCRFIKNANSRHNFGKQGAPRYADVVFGLQIHPKPLFHFEKQAQAQSGICRDGAVAIHNVADAARRHVNIRSLLPAVMCMGFINSSSKISPG